jgi:septal ring factor EnvC (AmiA/AmiB activator)
MAMESVLKDLESKIEELVEAYRGATARSAELEAKVAELEGEIGKLETKLSTSTDANDRMTKLEEERDQLATRLEKVLGLIDGVLEN